MTEQLDSKLIDAVKKFEGFEPVAKWDYKQWTNGYGTRAHRPHEPISRAEAERRLETELLAAQAAVDHFESPLPPGVRMALTDLTFNAGTGWMHSGLGFAVQEKDWEAVKTHLLAYDMAGGHVNAALESRRKTEASWFEKTVDA